MTKTYCCVQFMETVGQGVERGMAIVPTRNLKFGDFFFLRFRCVAEEYVNSIPDTGDIPVTLSVEQAIQYCPWCGMRLADVYAKTFSSLPYVTETE